MLDGSVLQYFKSEGALERPNGAVLVDQCTVTARDESAAADGSLRWGFALVHPCGDTLVLATETKAERAIWMEAVQPSSNMATPADGAVRGAAGSGLAETEAKRGEAAALETPAALAEVEAKRGEAQAALSAEEAALEAARTSLQSTIAASERAEAQLRQARARLKVRKSLLHWRYRTLRRSFVQLIRAVYATKEQGRPR